MDNELVGSNVDSPVNSPVEVDEGGFAGVINVLAEPSPEPSQQEQLDKESLPEDSQEEAIPVSEPTPDPEPKAKPAPVTEPQLQSTTPPAQSKPVSTGRSTASPPQSKPVSTGKSTAPQSKSQSTGGASARPDPPEGPQDIKAREFIQQAEKKIKSSQSFFGGLFGSGSAKLEEAADLYVRAANAYKVGKRYRAAGKAFSEAAILHLNLDTKHEAASNYVEAGQVLKRDDPREATECYLKAVEIYTDMGRFSLAARYHSTVAEIFETELQDYEEAIVHYEQASDFYKGEDSVGSSNKALLKVAHMCATMQKFDKSAGIFEEIGRNSLGNTLLKYAAKDYLFKAALCNFCIGPQNAREAIGRYRQLHPGFEGTRELKLIQDLLVVCEEEDMDKFADIVKDYDAISRLDPWITGLLLHIKKAVSATPDHV